MLRGSSSTRGAARDCLVPMPESLVGTGDRFDNISAIRKTLFGLPEFASARV